MVMAVYVVHVNILFIIINTYMYEDNMKKNVQATLSDYFLSGLIKIRCIIRFTPLLVSHTVHLLAKRTNSIGTGRILDKPSASLL